MLPRGPKTMNPVPFQPANGQGHHHLVLDGVEILLQVTDGLMFLAGRGLVLKAVTSHAVQIVNRRLAKLGMLELTGGRGSRCPDLLTLALS